MRFYYRLVHEVGPLPVYKFTARYTPLRAVVRCRARYAASKRVRAMLDRMMPTAWGGTRAVSWRRRRP